MGSKRFSFLRIELSYSFGTKKAANNQIPTNRRQFQSNCLCHPHLSAVGSRELDYVYKPGLGDNPLGNLSGRTKLAVVASCKEQGESIKRDL